MGEKTKIAWADSTISPWIGCEKCSPGCDRCYAKGIADRFYSDVTWGTDTSKWRMVRTFFERTMALERKAVRIGRPLFVFPSMCDPFYTPVEWLPVDWAETAERTPHLIWLLLTKRPHLIPGFEWPRNVWLGVTAENQEWADKRIPILMQKQCAVRFVSVEPMLGPVDLANMSFVYGGYNALKPYVPKPCDPRLQPSPNIGWVICGGESGSGARKMELTWAMNLYSQCASAGVPFWFKQWGSAHGREMAHCDQLWGKVIQDRPGVVL